MDSCHVEKFLPTIQNKTRNITTLFTDNRKEAETMRKRTAVGTFEGVRMLSTDEGVAYSGLGRSTFRKWADEIGATRKIGARVLFDRLVIDKALDEA